MVKELKNGSKYDLENRTYQFARSVRKLVKVLPKNIINYEDGRQIVRSSGSVGANYIEANESLSSKDFIYRIKICRKESKESQYWLQLIFDLSDHKEGSKKLNLELINESNELKRIFSAIIISKKESY